MRRALVMSKTIFIDKYVIYIKVAISIISGQLFKYVSLIEIVVELA